MIENSVELSKIDWKRTFPWVRLFRVFHTAIDLRMLLLGSVAVALLVCGDTVLSHLPFAPARDNIDVTFGWNERPQAVDPRAVPEGLLQNPWRGLIVAGADWGAVLRPVRTVVIPLHTILQADATWSQKTFAWTRLLWALCIWAVVGGAMCRIAAVEQTRDTKITLQSALSFSLTNFPSYMTATLLARRRYRHLLGPVRDRRSSGLVAGRRASGSRTAVGAGTAFRLRDGVDLDRGGGRLAVDVCDDQHRSQRRI